MKLKDIRQLTQRLHEVDGTALDFRAAKIIGEIHGFAAALKVLDDVKPQRPKYAVVVSRWHDHNALLNATHQRRAIVTRLDRQHSDQVCARASARNQVADLRCDRRRCARRGCADVQNRSQRTGANDPQV